MQIDIVSVFPEYFDVTGLSLLGKAQEKGLVTIRAHNLRDWTHDVHHSVDDTPVGGGAGMVMKPEVWGRCLDDLLDMPDGSALQPPTMDQTTDTADTEEEKEAMKSSGDKSHGIASEADLSADSHEADLAGPVLIFPNPSAPLFTQADATELSRTERLIFGCGRYEGYDARIPDYYRNQGIDVREYSIGDYVLNGGEVAVSVMLEAITRLLPGFMGNPESMSTPLATMYSMGAKWPSRSCWRPSPGSCQASWAILNPSCKSPIPGMSHCWSIASTHAPPPGVAWLCPTAGISPVHTPHHLAWHGCARDTDQRRPRKGGQIPARRGHQENQSNPSRPDRPIGLLHPR